MRTRAETEQGNRCTRGVELRAQAQATHTYNRSVLVDLCDHVVLRVHLTKLLDRHLWVLGDGCAALMVARLTQSEARVAIRLVEAQLIGVLSLILLARDIRNTARLGNPLESSERVPPLARAGVATVENSLYRRHDVANATVVDREGALASKPEALDLEAVPEGRHGGMRPARAAVDGNVLIL